VQLTGLPALRDLLATHRKLRGETLTPRARQRAGQV